MNEESKNKAVELTDEEIQKAAGGTTSSVTFTCQSCGKQNTMMWDATCGNPPCQYCGYINANPSSGSGK